MSDEDFTGRVVVKLEAKVVPKTAENFRQLCFGDFGYKNSLVRIVNPGLLLVVNT